MRERVYGSPLQNPNWIRQIANLVLPARLPFAPMVLPEDVHQQPDAAGGGADEADDGQAGVAEDAEACLHTHQQGRADDERGEDQARGDAIGDFLEAIHQEMRVGWLNIYVQFCVTDGVENFI